jgi:RimJ/RimL family protein N-acetyltransferase
MTDAERVLAFDRRMAAALAERSEPFEHGVAHFEGSLPKVYDRNYLAVEDGTTATAEELAAAADRIQGPAGLLHRKVAVDDAEGERLAPGFRRLGWQAQELVVMVHRGEPAQVTQCYKASEAAAEEMEPFWAASAREEPHGRDEEVVRQLVGDRLHHAGPARARWFAARDGGRVVAGCDLYSDGQVAQIESVGTLSSHRGRGLGTAVVSAALAAAYDAGHELVFLVADAEDWPKDWYARLGFEPVWTLWDFVRTVEPLRAIRIRTPRLELRLPTEAELVELAELAREGVHPPERMPFVVPWTNRAGKPTFVEDVCAFHLDTLARWSPDDWSLNLVAFVDGRVAGTQGVGSAGPRTVKTGSWLGTAFQDRGLGTEMRAAVLELAFRDLGAEAAESGAFVDNPQSHRVSEKLGYRQVGEATHAPRGEPVRELLYRLEREDWASPVPVEIENLEPALPLFGLRQA